MSVWGLVLSAVGAAIVAAGQIATAHSVNLWLTALELEKDSRNARGDIHNVVLGRGQQMKAAINRNTWLAPAGWAIFIVGILMQIVPFFRRDGFAALSLF